MKRHIKYLTYLLLSAAVLIFSTAIFVMAEDLPAGVTIPKLAKTAEDPALSNGKVYPFWGPVCQRYTYSVVYSDKKGRAPEYVQIYFNGKMLDMEKENSTDSDYKKGVKYIYKYAPSKYGSNFYYFEASNGSGKARASIIDSPDNGPVLFDADFKHNEIVLIDTLTGEELWRYSTGEEWVGAMALSDDGKFLAAQTSNHIHLFDAGKNEPLWSYESPAKANIGGDVKGGVAISDDGQKIFAALDGKALMFDKDSNKPLWTYNLEANGGGAYGVDIARNGQYAAVAMAGSEADENSNVLILFNAEGKKLWQYHASGNWHEVNFSADGNYIAGSTGCPDRRGYIFSKDSAEPIIKSEPLSKESPIDEARISSNGDLAVYGVESGYGAIVLMDKNTKQIIWKYETPQAKSVRALSMTPNGDYIGAGTFGGDILIFNKNSNLPTEQLNINSAIGAFDIAGDASFFATGSADKKVRIFERGTVSPKAEINLNEYVGEIDISGNGKYLAAGTSGSVYFFETIIDLNNIKTAACSEITEPPKEDSSLFGGQNSGNTAENTGDNKKIFSLPIIISIIGAGLFLVLLAAYLIFCRRKRLPCKKIFIIIAVFLIAISLGIAFYLWYKERTVNTASNAGEKVSDEVEENSETGETESSSTAETTETTGNQNVVKTENDKSSTDTTANIEADVKTSSGADVCGNGICEPDLNENKDTCAKDCTNGN